MNKLVSDATKRNWNKLNADSSTKLTKRANKRLSKKKILPIEYLSNSDNTIFIRNVISLFENNNWNMENMIYSFGISLLEKHNLLEKENVKKILKEMKYKIFIGEMVSVEDFEFYKDDKYSGRTIQNNILYLAKVYGIKIPLATQGFINNRLKSYNFKTRECFYKIIDENKRCSTKMGIYLEQISQKVQEEYKEGFKRKMKLVPEKSMER